MSDRPSGIDPSQRLAGRVAALAYLVSVPLVVHANFGMRGRLFVRGDLAETVRRIAAAEPLFRLSAEPVAADQGAAEIPGLRP